MGKVHSVSEKVGCFFSCWSDVDVSASVMLHVRKMIWVKISNAPERGTWVYGSAALCLESQRKCFQN